MKNLALFAIALYQRHLSPRKGYCCAWRMHKGGQSCSAYGHCAIGRHGLRLGLALLKRRLAACAEVALRHAPTALPASHLRRQAGFCDVPFDCAPSELACDLVSLASDCSLSSCSPWPKPRGRGDPHIGVVPNAPPFQEKDRD